MMKRKFLAVVLPIIGCATVVGSGFSAWYFGTDVVSGDNGSFSIGINVTDEVKASKGNLKINSNATTIDDVTTIDEVEYGPRLVLDQGGAGNTSVDSGIMFGDETSTVTTATGNPDNNKVWAFTVSYDGTAGGTVGDSLTIDEIYDAGLRIRVEMTVTIDSTLNKYIEYQADADLPTFKVNTTTPEHLGTNPAEFEFSKTTVESDPTVRTANYIVDATKLGATVTDKLELNFSLDLNTYEKEIKNEDGSKVIRKDYSNKLFVYKDNSAPGGVYNGGKPINGDQLAIMKGAESSTVVFSVIAYIEDDPTR